MKRKSNYKAIFGLASFVLASLVLVNVAKADGTEQLGDPSIDIALGSDIVVAGVGLADPGAQPGDISVEIPAGASVEQVLLYWTGRSVEAEGAGATDTIQVNGMAVMGPLIGGPSPAPNPYPSSTYRADITDSNWVVSAAVNIVSVGGLDFTYQNDGAAVVVILDDGSMSVVNILDGNDFAYLPRGDQTEPVVIPVEPSDEIQTVMLSLIVSDVAAPRPASIQITVDGVTTNLLDVLHDNEGNFMDVVELEVDVPAGETNITVQLFSIDDGSGLQPASLAWHFVSWILPVPDEDEGCTYTQGYWKNHPEAWPTNNPSIFTDMEAMELLQTKPKGGNAYIILAHQYIAAALNVGNGASIPDDVLAAWLVGQDLLIEYASEEDIDKKDEPEDRAWAIDLAGMLDDYNNGDLGPGHCDDEWESLD